MSLLERFANELAMKSSLNKSLGISNLGPVEFCATYFNDKFTPQIEEVLQSVCDNRVTIVQSANAVGKTHCAARIALWWYKEFADAKIFTTMPPPVENLEKLLWGEIGATVARFPKVFAKDKCITLELSDGPDHFMVGVSIPAEGSRENRMAKFSGKHSPHLLFIIDEGDGVPAEIYEAIESCMSGGMARLLVLFNPRQKGGPIQSLEKSRSTKVIKLSALDHPNVITGDDMNFPGAVTRESVVRRIEEWTEAIPLNRLDEYKDSKEFIFEVPDFLVPCVKKDENDSNFRKVIEARFSTMVLGEYPPTSTYAVFSQDSLEHAFQPHYVNAEGEKIAGLDVAEYGSDSTVLAVLHDNYITRIWSWTGLNTLQTSDYVTAILKSEGIRKIVVDGNGVGSGVWPLLRQNGFSVCRFMSTNKPTGSAGELGTFGNARAEMYWRFREWVRKGGQIFDDKTLKEELEATTYEVKQGKIFICPKEKIRQKLGRSPDRADACAYCFYHMGEHYVESVETRWHPVQKETMARTADLTFPRPMEWAEQRLHKTKSRLLCDNPNGMIQG